MEMSSEQLIMRLISSLARVELQRIRTGQITDVEWDKVTTASTYLVDAPLFIDDTPTLSPAELRTKLRRLTQSEGQLGLVVVDYLQLMQSSTVRENRVAEVTEISRSLKAAAKELRVPLIALSLLNRGLEQRPNKRPKMADLRDSGSIEQDADLILFVYRDEVYNEESKDKGIAEVIIAKQRNGPVGCVQLIFEGQYTQFSDVNGIGSIGGSSCTSRPVLP
jgi:replicative DNA helicase